MPDLDSAGPRVPPLGKSTPLVPPLYQSAVYTLPDLDALDRIMEGDKPGFIYARDAHPNAHELAATLSHLEAANWSLVCGSGMAALTASILAFVRSGDRILASNRLYGRSNQLRGCVLDPPAHAGGTDSISAVTSPQTKSPARVARPHRLLLLPTSYFLSGSRRKHTLQRDTEVQGQVRHHVVVR